MRRPEGLLSVQQRQVWELLERWEPDYPDPVGVLTHIERQASGPQPGRPLHLSDVGRARRAAGRVARVYVSPGGPARASTWDPSVTVLPPFVLLVDLDADPPAAAPVVRVLTADLGVAIVVDAQPGGSVLGHRVVLVHRVPGTGPGASTGAWQSVLLTEASDRLAVDLAGILGTVEPDAETMMVARLVLAPPGAPGSQPPAPLPPPGWGSSGPSQAPDPFPDPAVPGVPPPPLPARRLFSDAATTRPDARHVTQPDARYHDPAIEGLRAVLGDPGTPGPPGRPGGHRGELLDPVDLVAEHRWRTRLACAPPAGWAAVRLLTLDALPRWVVGDPPAMLIEDDSCQLVAALLDVRSLPSAGQRHPPLSRLRLLHERLLTAPALVPGSTRWSTLLGADGVLDELVAARSGLPAAFSLAADTGLPLGDEGASLLAVVAGTAPPHRSAVLARPEEVAAHLDQPPGPLEGIPPTWISPPGWTRTEELQLTTEELLVRVRLEPVAPGTDLDQWEQELFDRAPYLRDRRPLGRRDVAVAGLSEARMHRFDWQPSGRGRMLTNVCVGVTHRAADPVGFSLVAEIGLDDDHIDLQPDDLLSRVRVLQEP